MATDPSMTSSDRATPRGVAWLALTLAMSYFGLMATLMWLFENSITVDDIAAALDDPRRRAAWAVIAITAIVVFMVSRWALGRISSLPRADAATPSPPGLSIDDARLRQQARRSRIDVIVFLSALGAILVGTGSFLDVEQQRALDAARHRQLAVIGKTKTASVSRWIDERQRDLRILLANPLFVAGLGRWMDQPTATGPDHERMLADMQTLLQANGFDGIAVLTREGKTGIGLPEDIRARSHCQQSAMALDAPGPPISMSFAFDDASGQPKLDLVGKAVETGGDARRHVATLCLRIDLNQRLLPMVSRWPGVATSGEVLLGRPEGQDIVQLNGRASGDAGWRLAQLPGDRAIWEAALNPALDQPLPEHVDAKGARKLLAVYPVASTPWLLMVRMDADESDQLQSRRQLRATIVIGFVLIFITASFAIAWARTSHARGSFHAQRDALLVELREMAYYDELTGLPGRRLIQDRLEVAIRDAARRNEMVGVMFIDLDKFKRINDEHSHAAGDFVLKTAAERMQHGLRQNDSAGRLSGDEFLIVLSGNASVEQLEELRHKIGAALQEPLTWQGTTLQVGASIGLAVYPRDGESAQELVAKADQAMYEVKNASR